MDLNTKKLIADWRKNEGITLSKSKILINQLFYTHSKHLSDVEFVGIAKDYLAYHLDKTIEFETSFIDNIATELTFKPFIQSITKYVDDYSVDYYKDGYIKLGTIQEYQTIEDSNRKDDLEGYSTIKYNLNNKDIVTSAKSGYNYLIFCATIKSNSIYHLEKFGKNQVNINNIRTFSELIKKCVNAKSYEIQRIHYNNYKTTIFRNNLLNDKIDLNKNCLNDEYHYDLLLKLLKYPSLFIKPTNFSKEEEVRIVFEMPKDLSKPKIITHKEIKKLLKFS
jgi:hypothetical protein